MRDKRKKLTETDVREIVASCRSGALQEDVAQRFSVSKSTIAFIMQGRTWTKVSGIPPLIRACPRCGGDNKGGLYKICIKCRERDRTREARSSGLCTECRRWRPSEGRKHCPECRTRRKSRADLLKQTVLEHYGGKCSCCGEANFKFLTIDHVNDDGAKHRHLRYRGWWSWIIKNNFPDDLQVLCWNCNCGRAYNGGVCPHKET